jgi:tetratricopeptide (TPR) repeat protein
VGDPDLSLVVGCAGLGNVLVAQGHFAGAVSALERGLGHELGDLSARVWPFIAAPLGAAYTHVGRITEAVPLLEEAVARAAAVRLKANHAFRLIRLAEAQAAAGRLDVAFPLAAQALDLAQEQRERGHEAWALRLIASIEARREPPALERAEESYVRALALAAQLGMRPLQAHCHLGLGRLRRQQGDPGAASDEIATARELYLAMDMTSWLADAE